MNISDINPDLLNLPPITASEQLLIEAYCREHLSLDHLPYTDGMDRMVSTWVGEPVEKLTKSHYRTALVTLQMLRSRRQLPRQGRHGF